jgi:hypothetical protein
VQAILLKPRQTWPVIAAEGGDTASIFTGYVYDPWRRSRRSPGSSA